MSVILLREIAAGCLTKAKRDVRAAIGRSDAWRRLVAPYNATEAATEAEALARVRLNLLRAPVDGLAFTLEELEQDSTAAVVLTQPEQALTRETSIALGTPTFGCAVNVVIERLVLDREASGDDDQLELFENAVEAVLAQTAADLEARNGPRWMQAVALEGAPAWMQAVRDEEVLGQRMQASLLYAVGPGGEGASADQGG